MNASVSILGPAAANPAPPQDEKEPAAPHAGLLKLSFERTTLLDGLGHDASGAKLQVNTSVNLASGNAFKINNAQIINARKTGWAAATGTATRTSFATTTVTTEQLAQRVKALLDDLISHGLIGA